VNIYTSHLSFQHDTVKPFPNHMFPSLHFSLYKKIYLGKCFIRLINSMALNIVYPRDMKKLPMKSLGHFPSMHSVTDVTTLYVAKFFELFILSFFMLLFSCCMYMKLCLIFYKLQCPTVSNV